MSDTGQPWIIAVDDELGILDDITRILGRRYRISTFNDPYEALEAMKQQGCPDLVLTDQRMPKMTGTELLQEVSKLYPDSVGVIVTGFTARGDLIGAINQAHVFAYVTKPWNRDQLLETTERALRMSVGRQASRELKANLDQLGSELGELKATVSSNKETLAQSFQDVRRQLQALAERSTRLHEPETASGTEDTR